MQISLRVSVLEEIRVFLGSSENALGLQLASATEIDFVGKQLALEARAHHPLIRFQKTPLAEGRVKGVQQLWIFDTLGRSTDTPSTYAKMKITSHIVQPIVPTNGSLQLDDILGFKRFSCATSLRRCHHGSTACQPASQRWRFKSRC